MKIYALSDLHLSPGGQKPMDVFGERWAGHMSKIAERWRATVSDDDVVCLPGDFSWALRLEDAGVELGWLGALPGRKVLVKGNHDYWWGSISKVRKALPEGVYAIQNDAVTIGGAAFAGARGWVDPALDFSALYSGFAGTGGEGEAEGGELYSIEGAETDRKIYERELGRLENSLSKLPEDAPLKVALLHFPPTSPSLEGTEVTALLEKYGVDAAVFGHLHLPGTDDGERPEPAANDPVPQDYLYTNPYGEKGGVRYYLASADFIDFKPVPVATVE